MITDTGLFQSRAMLAFVVMFSVAAVAALTFFIAASPGWAPEGGLVLLGIN